MHIGSVLSELCAEAGIPLLAVKFERRNGTSLMRFPVKAGNFKKLSPEADGGAGKPDQAEVSH